MYSSGRGSSKVNFSSSQDESNTEADHRHEDSMSGLPSVNERLCNLSSIYIIQCVVCNVICEF